MWVFEVPGKTATHLIQKMQPTAVSIQREYAVGRKEGERNEEGGVRCFLEGRGRRRGKATVPGKGRSGFASARKR